MKHLYMSGYVKNLHMCVHAAPLHVYACIMHQAALQEAIHVPAYTNKMEMLANPLTYEHSDVMRKWVDVCASRPECVVCL